MTQEEVLKSLAESLSKCVERIVSLEGTVAMLTRSVMAGAIATKASEESLLALLTILASENEALYDQEAFRLRYLEIFTNAKRTSIQEQLEKLEDTDPGNAAKVSDILGNLFESN